MGDGFVIYLVVNERGEYMCTQRDGYTFNNNFTEATLFYDRHTAEGYCDFFKFPTWARAHEVRCLEYEDNKN